jgi:hypothetical protein
MVVAVAWIEVAAVVNVLSVAGLTVSAFAKATPFITAVMMVVFAVSKPLAVGVIVKVLEVVLAATVTDAGTVAAVMSLEASVTRVATVGAELVVRVPVTVGPPPYALPNEMADTVGVLVVDRANVAISVVHVVLVVPVMWMPQKSRLFSGSTLHAA